MSAELDKRLSYSDQNALNLYLVEALTEEETCAAAQITRQRFAEISTSIVPFLRGQRIGYNRFLLGKNIVETDPMRLDYEVRLTQLHHQHQMCVDAYSRTDDYAKHVIKNHLSQSGADPLSPKAIAGDIRFLQLARAIRHEMDQVEAKLAERIELLRTHRARAQSNQKPATTEAASPAESPVTPPEPPHPITGSAAALPTAEASNQAQITIDRPTPAEVKAPAMQIPMPAAAQVLPQATKPNSFLGRDDLLASLNTRQIPEIAPPPRKLDKYSKPAPK